MGVLKGEIGPIKAHLRERGPVAGACRRRQTAPREDLAPVTVYIQ